MHALPRADVVYALQAPATQADHPATTEQAVLHAARTYQHTDDFWSRYTVRAGIEGTISQAVVALEMRRSRYRGAAKPHVQHVATAVACNIKRIVNWWNDVPFAATRASRFARLMAT